MGIFNDLEFLVFNLRSVVHIYEVDGHEGGIRERIFAIHGAIVNNHPHLVDMSSFIVEGTILCNGNLARCRVNGEFIDIGIMFISIF